MSIFLNILALAACIIWFHTKMNAVPKKRLMPVSITFLVATILIYMLSENIETGFLDVLGHLVYGTLSVLGFWIWTTIVIIYKNQKTGNQQYTRSDLLQTGIVLIILIVPLIAWLSLRNVPLKIGG